MPIEIPRHPKYSQWSAHSIGIDTFPCVICGKPIKLSKAKYRVYMANSGNDLLSIEEAEKDPSAWEKLGMHPIGSDCLRQHPELQGYVVDTPFEAEEKRKRSFYHDQES